MMVLAQVLFLLMLLGLGLWVTVVGIYLATISVAAFVAAPAITLPSAGRRRFAVLVPAYNEATVIGRLLDSLAEQEYPRQRFDVFVVADNCVDDTAAQARAKGAIVYERSDATAKAKGHALRWLLERVEVHGRYEAYVVIDADSVVSCNFLSAMNARMERGSKVIQAHYRVLNASASSISALREAAFASLHYLRPLGRSALGLSCGLKGNGMCFEATVLDAKGWSTAGLTEDVEMHLDLVGAGLHVDFAPEAVVRADMPTSLRAATSQNERWEAGRAKAARSDAVRLLVNGFARGNRLAIDAAVEQLIPPLSVAVAVGLLTAAMALLGGAAVPAGLALFGTALLIAHVIAGLLITRAAGRTYFALLAAPLYIPWKVAIWARALVAAEGLAWTRTPRPVSADASDQRPAL